MPPRDQGRHSWANAASYQSSHSASKGCGFFQQGQSPDPCHCGPGQWSPGVWREIANRSARLSVGKVSARTDHTDDRNLACASYIALLALEAQCDASRSFPIRHRLPGITTHTHTRNLALQWGAQSYKTRSYQIGGPSVDWGLDLCAPPLNRCGKSWQIHPKRHRH